MPARRLPRCVRAGLKLPSAAFEAGMIRVDWPARMQRLSHGRLVALLPPESELWLDGGHNADGGRAIAEALADLEERVSRPLVLIVGMLSTKDSEGFLRNFSGLGAPRHCGADPSGQSRARCRRWPTLPAASPFRRSRATRSCRRFRSPANSISIRRRASLSPARCTLPAKCWQPTARRRSDIFNRLRTST